MLLLPALQLQSYPAEGPVASHVFEDRMADLFLFFFNVDGLTLASAFAFGSHLYPTASLEVQSQNVNLWDLQLFSYHWKPAKLSQYINLEGSLALMLRYPQTHAHTQSYIHTLTHLLLSACSAAHQGTKVREHHLMLKDLTNAHCSTSGTVFVATLD